MRFFIEDSVLTGFDCEGERICPVLDIPEGVTELKDDVFRCCNNVEKCRNGSKCCKVSCWKGPEYCKEICRKGSKCSFIIECCVMTKVNLPDSLVKIGEEVFRGSGLVSLALPPRLREIGGGAFMLSKLESAAFPDSLEKIGASAFQACGSLREISIPKSVREIGMSAFNCCVALERAYLPNDLNSIPEMLFFRCGKLNTVSLPEKLTSISRLAFKECGSLTGVKLPETLREIGDCAFMYSGLERIIIPKSVKEIGTSAFSCCVALERAYLPNDLNSIPEMLFFRCTKLNTLSLPEKLTSIGRSAFRECGSLTGVKLPENLREIGDSAFKESGLESIIIPNSVKEIGKYAFCGNLNLVEAVLSEGLEAIPTGMFSLCTSLTHIELPENLREIGDCAFKESGLESIIIPNSVKKIGEFAFYRNKNLVEAVLPEGLEAIPTSMFSECTNLTRIELPNSVKEIGDCAFRNVPFEEIRLPESIEHIGDKAFVGCKPRSVYIPAKMRCLEGVFNADAQKLIIDEANPYYICEDGYVLTSDRKILIFAEDRETMIIPESVECIGKCAVNGCKKLKHIVLPRGLKEIRDYAICLCPELTEVKLPVGLEKLGRALLWCDKLNKLVIPCGVREFDARFLSYWMHPDKTFTANISVPVCRDTVIRRRSISELKSLIRGFVKGMDSGYAFDSDVIKKNHRFLSSQNTQRVMALGAEIIGYALNKRLWNEKAVRRVMVSDCSIEIKALCINYFSERSEDAFARFEI